MEWIITMKKYLDKTQTETLQRLGFPSLNYITEFWENGVVNRKIRYSVGDLLDLIPKMIITKTNTFHLRIDEHVVGYYFAYWNKSIYVTNFHLELIDNLFDLLIKLKHEELIKWNK